jgi:S-adenosylmethionine hydrolase
MDKKKIVALLTDFGDRAHFVGTMKGVILNVDPDIKILDISHNIAPQNILETAFTLSDTLKYWPQGTVFVAVVDPGVGLPRKSLAVKTFSGHIILCPDNGILTEVLKDPGLEDVRVVPETANRLPGSDMYHTFHGRDLFAYIAGKLASGATLFGKLGYKMDEPVMKLPIQAPTLKYGTIEGVIVKIEDPFGNLCTNIPGSMVTDSGILMGDLIPYEILESGGLVHKGEAPFVRTFGEVKQKTPLAYIDSSGRFGLAVSMGNFSQEYKIKAGLSWRIRIECKAR